MASESTTTTTSSTTSLGPLGGGAGFLLAYLASSALRSPVAWYFPLEHRWTFEVRPMAGLGMDFYGRLLLSLLCGAVAYALAHPELGRPFRAHLKKIINSTQTNGAVRSVPKRR